MPGTTRQRLLVLLGVGVTLLAFSADRLGWGQPGTFGRGQLLLALAGFALLAAGFLGRRARVVYRGAALMLANTIVLLVFLEFASIVAARSGILPGSGRSVLAGHGAIADYANREWWSTYRAEAGGAESYRYEPYVVWRHAPFAGTTIHVDAEGRRRTPGADCSPGSYTVFGFGGSTMWGWGAPDWETIPAHLQRGLSARQARPVCVINLAEDAFVSTQSVIELVKELQAGRVPDAVVFYDGVNDVFAAHQTGRAGSHPDLERVAEKLEEREHPLVTWATSSRLYAVTRNLVDRVQAASGDPPADAAAAPALAQQVVAAYLANHRAVGALAREWGFEAYFFWQPHLALAKQELTEPERALRSSLDPGLSDLAQAVYEEMERRAHGQPRLWYLGSALDEHTEQVWTDEWGHVTPSANQAIAERMLAAIEARSRRD